MKEMVQPGDRFGILLVMQQMVDAQGKPMRKWHCRCDCGVEKVAFQSALLRGKSNSCGCYRTEARVTHGHSRKGGPSRAYHTWVAMLQRCYNTSHKQYAVYGGRGVRVCDRWNTASGGSFQNFLADMGDPPIGMELDKDKLGNGLLYSPETCCWLSRKEQSQYRRTNRRLELNGVSHTISEWSQVVGIGPGTLLQRLKLGWSAERVLTTPVRRTTVRRELCHV